MAGLSSGLLRRVVWWKISDVSEVLAVFIVTAMIGPANFVSLFYHADMNLEPDRYASFIFVS
jgi:hypothetical protein